MGTVGTTAVALAAACAPPADAATIAAKGISERPMPTHTTEGMLAAPHAMVVGTFSGLLGVGGGRQRKQDQQRQDAAHTARPSQKSSYP